MPTVADPTVATTANTNKATPAPGAVTPLRDKARVKALRGTLDSQGRAGRNPGAVHSRGSSTRPASTRQFLQFLCRVWCATTPPQASKLRGAHRRVCLLDIQVMAAAASKPLATRTSSTTAAICGPSNVSAVGTVMLNPGRVVTLESQR